jgi:eukaryotic-like serine/threonine-protein kinase
VIAADLLRENPEDVNRLISCGAAVVAMASLEREVGGKVSPEARASLDEVSQRLERSTLTDPAGLCNLACVYSFLSGLEPLDKILPADQAQQEQAAAAERAMAALRRAFDAGWNDMAHMNHDPDLDPLRARPDFRVLMMDLAMPADPFAPPD